MEPVTRLHEMHRAHAAYKVQGGIERLIFYEFHLSTPFTIFANGLYSNFIYTVLVYNCHAFIFCQGSSHNLILLWCIKINFII